MARRRKVTFKSRSGKVSFLGKISHKVEPFFIKQESDRLAKVLFNKEWKNLNNKQKEEVNKVGWEISQ